MHPSQHPIIHGMGRGLEAEACIKIPLFLESLLLCFWYTFWPLLAVGFRFHHSWAYSFAPLLVAALVHSMCSTQPWLPEVDSELVPLFLITGGGLLQPSVISFSHWSLSSGLQLSTSGHHEAKEWSMVSKIGNLLLIIFPALE